MSRYIFKIIALPLLLLAAFPCAANEAREVVFIRYNLKDKSDSAMVDAFRKIMETRGYSEGNNIKYIDYTTSAPDSVASEEVMRVTEEYMPKADMFITTGWTSLYVRSKLAKSRVPQLFTPALKSTALDILPRVDAEPGTNLSGIYLDYPPEKILRLTRHIFPKLRRYGFIYDSRIPTDMIFKAEYGQLNESQRYGITIYYFDLAAGTDAVLQKMKTIGVEAAGGVIGLLKTLPELSESGMPMITSLLFDRPMNALEESIEGSSIVAGLFNPFDYCGQQAAEMTADIFDNKTSIEKTVPRPARQVVFVSLKAAGRFNVSVPFSVLEAVDIVIR